MSLSLEYAQITDLPYIVEVYNSIVAGGEVTADLKPVTQADWTPWFEKHNQKDRPVWLLQADGLTVGWMSFKDYHSRPAYKITAEVSLYLHENHRMQGLGEKFLLMGLEYIKKQGVKNVIGLVFSSNKPSTRLFAKTGFEVWGLLPDVCVIRGIQKDVLILGRQL